MADGIAATKKLKAGVMLLPFFGKGALRTPAEFDYVGDALRDLGKEAEKAGVILALEDTISAKDNVRIMERSRSKAVKTYYDVGNATFAGFNPLEEMPWLGASRIAQIHLKDKGYLGEGQIDFPAVMNRIMDLGFNGFANLETASPKSVEGRHDPKPPVRQKTPGVRASILVQKPSHSAHLNERIPGRFPACRSECYNSFCFSDVTAT